MATAPLTIAIRNPKTYNYISLSNQLEQIQISTAAPGGFGTFTFQMSERAASTLTSPLQSFYACDVSVTDNSGSILFEGILTDVKIHSDASDAYYEVECTGWQILLDNTPYRNIVIERDIPWVPLNVGWNPTLVRNDLFTTIIGVTDSSDPTKVGLRFDCQGSRVCGTFQLCGVQVYFPVGVGLQRFYYDWIASMNSTAQFAIEYQLIEDGGLGGSGTLITTGTVSSGQSSIALGANTRGLIVYFICHTPGTAAAAMSCALNNLRFTANRWSTAGNISVEPVVGHEVVSDILNRSQLPTDLSGIEFDTSYQIPEFSYPTSVTAREALDAITAYYNRYWAVWENKKLWWRSWSRGQSADWVVSRDSGAQVDIDPSITNAASVVRIRYTDPTGVAVETDITDANQDNVYALAGRTKTAIVDLGIVSTSVAAPQVGAVYFPDHSYEVVGGTITLPANSACFSQTYGNMQKAYKIRAGDSVRLRDGTSVRSIFDATSWNRATLFRITATDLDWEGQTMKLTLDNSQASLDQLTARISTNLSAKYGA